MNLTFIGNCQTLSLCFYLQQLLDSNKNNICWILYGKEFEQHLNNWSDKCINKILNYDDAIIKIQNSDIIVYQEIDIDKSIFCNTKKLQEIKKSSCKLIKMPSIWLDYNDYDNSLKELQSREKNNNVDIMVTSTIDKFKNINLMLTINHPKTFFFLEIIRELCLLINIDFFTENQCNKFLENENYMDLPFG
jgi:hypothetical protein